MNVHWLIESTVFDESDKNFTKSLEDAGIQYRTCDEKPVWEYNRSFLDFFEPTDCVVFRGSLQFGVQVNRKASWIPAIYADLPKYKCTNYYPYFGNNLLNEEYVMLPYGELRRRKEWLFDKVGADRTVFIRPDRGDKIFTGKAVYKERWEEDLKLLGFYNVEDSELCVVAYPYHIMSEWRWVVVDGKIITGSEYRTNFSRVYPPVPAIPGGQYWNEAQQFVNDSGFNPERVWVIDTCITEGNQHKVLEAGCFSCAGLYGCDTDIIVKEVSRVALEDWKEVSERPF